MVRIFRNHSQWFLSSCRLKIYQMLTDCFNQLIWKQHFSRHQINKIYVGFLVLFFKTTQLWNFTNSWDFTFSERTILCQCLSNNIGDATTTILICHIHENGKQIKSNLFGVCLFKDFPYATTTIRGNGLKWRTCWAITLICSHRLQIRMRWLNACCVYVCVCVCVFLMFLLSNSRLCNLASGGFAEACQMGYIKTRIDHITSSSTSAINIIALSSDGLILDTQAAYQNIAIQFTGLRVSWALIFLKG